MTTADLGRFPVAWPLPPGYERHEPSLAQTTDAMQALVAKEDWVKLSWPDLLAGLAAVGRTDIPLARLTEGHVDALRILAEAGRVPVANALYGVWASRSHRTGLTAVATEVGWQVSGTLRFASGAGILDRALIPVWPSPNEHLLLDIDVRRWIADGASWQTRAMQVSRSHTFVLTDQPVESTAQIGPPGFYLDRAGFFPGGVGVAAVWAGGAARLLDLLLAYDVGAPRSVSRSMRLGHVRIDLATVHAMVAVAGLNLERGTCRDPREVATLARSSIAAGVERVIAQIRRLAGPAGLAYAGDLTRAVDDLDLYVRQLNPDSDAEYLGDLAS